MSSRLQAALALAILAAGLWLLFESRSRSNHPKPGAAPAPSAVTEGRAPQAGVIDQALLKNFLEIEAEEKERDRTIWAPEITAQSYEEPFIQLWDALRQSRDRIALLKQFQFGALRCGTYGAPAPHQHGISVRTQGEPAREISPLEWTVLLDRWQAAGYAIENVECRQRQFDPAAAGEPARSVFSVAVHAANLKTGEKTILRGDLKVAWTASDPAHFAATPEMIDARGIEQVTRPALPAFQEMFVERISPPEKSYFIDPLIVYDLDGDGRSDIVLACKNLVYWNRGDWKFEAGELCDQPTKLIFTAIIADFNGDGHADFLCADRTGLVLHAGDGKGHFPGPGMRVWTAPERLRYAQVLTAGDIDGDGDLDIWLAQYRVPTIASEMPNPYYDANDGFPSFLLLNDGAGHFRDATVERGLGAKRHRRTYSSSLVDLDDDGALDLLVVSDFCGIDLYRNDGQGRFSNVTSEWINEPRLLGMAHAFGDFNLDGRLDFIAIGMDSSTAARLDHLHLGPAAFPEMQAMRPKMTYGNRLFLSSGHGFRQASFNDQIARSGWSWGVTAFDFDNDGDLDLYIANGHESKATVKDYDRQFWRSDVYLGLRPGPGADLYLRAMGRKRMAEGVSYGGYYKNHFFLQEQGAKEPEFLNVAWLFGVGMEEDSRNVASDDLDGDGRLDLLVTTFETWPETRQTLRLFKNSLNDAGNWVGFRFREQGPGASALGAKIVLRRAGQTQAQQMVSGDSFRTQHGPVAHFGLGSATNVESVEVRWPDGKTQRFANPGINQYHDIQRPP